MSANDCPILAVINHEPMVIVGSQATPGSGKASLPPRVKPIVTHASPRIIAQTPVTHLRRVTLSSIAEVGKRSPMQSPISKYAVKVATPEICSSGLTRLQVVGSPKFRKILPKPQLCNAETLPIAKLLQKCVPSATTTTNFVPNADILIIPKNDKGSAPNGFDKVVYTGYPGNKRPILRITINKEYDSNRTHDENDDSCEVTTNSESSTKDVDASTPEMTIENSSTNKAVTFKLDPKSGEIVVTTRPIEETTGCRTRRVRSTMAKQQDDDAYTSPSHLRKMYAKGQQECNALRKKLRLLRKRQKIEQDEIERLEDHLTELGDKVRTNRSDETMELRSVKRRATEDSVQSDNCETTTEVTKRMRHDGPRTRIFSSTMTNKRSANQ